MPVILSLSISPFDNNADRRSAGEIKLLVLLC